MTNRLRIQAIMLDWAGTIVDHGSMAPVLALQTLFSQHGITLSIAEARRDMGLLKRDHIRAILTIPGVRAKWSAMAGSEPGESELDALFAEFGPLQMQIIAQHSQVIPGVAETVQQWQSSGIRIGSTTGYTRTMLEPVMAQAAQQGFKPDASVCPDEVSAGRPAPWMLMRNAELLNVYPPAACVKIGDTVIDIHEGRNAGMWTIGLTRTGNLIGLDREHWDQLPVAEKKLLLDRAANTLLEAGADFIAEDLASCSPALAEIERRLDHGKRILVEVPCDSLKRL
jgi:phosphonoacetaldehyde hydrolase